MNDVVSNGAAADVTQPLMQAADGRRYQLNSPTALPMACAFLWNDSLMIQQNCRGYATAQFMQPEPAKYAHAPNLEAKTFMQPEQPYYAHHPGRFVYIKDEDSGAVWSAPYEPVRRELAAFEFSAGQADIRWTLRLDDTIELVWQLTLAPDAPHELWQLSVRNLGSGPRRLSLYPYFPVGYMSWMNQGGRFDAALNAVICSSVTPYQKYPDYFKNKHFKDKTFLLAERTPAAFEVRQQAFEGEGGLHAPDGVTAELLGGGSADYETPACVLQYRTELQAGALELYRFVFGPAETDAEVAALRARYFPATANSPAAANLPADGFSQAAALYQAKLDAIQSAIEIQTPEPAFDNFINQWLPRQVYYHGAVNRLTTDPQTRNYLQDNMGMAYLAPQTARQALLTALSQQHANGEMPDGILLHKDAELKYINQVPHTDQCVWLPIFLRAYLDETGDYALLQTTVPFAAKAGETPEQASVFEHLCRAMGWLWLKKDARNLSYIEQGDWCDPMNMVGYKGKGVSAWLSLAAAYALKLWAGICRETDQLAQAELYETKAQVFNDAVNRHLWDGQWYGRGITDDDVVFGVSKDVEGRIWLNPQSWALLSGAADQDQQQQLLAQVKAQLHTPYGVQMLAPAFTAMREDVGRVTQKFPGSAENGSVYNHAAAFYLYALYQTGQSDTAYQVLSRMLPSQDEADQRQRGQLPVYIPNYYRGAYWQYPRTAGRSSQLFNTGTVHWVYRSLIEHLFGLKGEGRHLRIAPQLPSHWHDARAQRQFRGATVTVVYQRSSSVSAAQVYLGSEANAAALLQDGLLKNPEAGQHYQLLCLLPLVTPALAVY